MRILGALERRIEQLVEGLFSRWAGHRVQPFDVRRQLLREMERGANGGSRRLVLPNRYDVLLHPGDVAPYRAARGALIRELIDALHARAGELGGSFDGPLRIQIVDRDGVPPGEIRVEARIEPLEARPETRRRSPADAAPRLRVLDGAPGGEGQEFPLSQPAATIGRDPGHAVVLSHPSVSRTHARIESGPAGTSIVDLGSTNGTILNGRILRNSRAPLRGGDRLQIGALVLEYLEPPNRQ